MFLSFIKLGDLFIFGCRGNDDLSKGIAIYDKDLNLINVFEYHADVICMKSIDN
jgi:hypothetical protein